MFPLAAERRGVPKRGHPAMDPVQNIEVRGRSPALGSIPLEPVDKVAGSDRRRNPTRRCRWRLYVPTSIRQ